MQWRLMGPNLGLVAGVQLPFQVFASTLRSIRSGAIYMN